MCRWTVTLKAMTVLIDSMKMMKAITANLVFLFLVVSQNRDLDRLYPGSDFLALALYKTSKVPRLLSQIMP
jgi:hypothetical protein